ncbi:ImmA/IrrE family metallo-endopeptidase [Sporolactobacillus terrae]|uniref:ImmA/IrrE family metallo-endopeptidase n=1 Tax=Sporolactobacillus terrae TaxID=269673 RepID=UPI0006853FCD|nr:ImmA/IrrE family metallo-endopeptidase [Sporolactobacillus terrae]UAK17601.1 ImmA/IrrE family metallo-endopeptidase [Sporolactobacillus terrae]
MNKPYTPPLVEKWVSDTLIKAGILYPSDICSSKICKAFDIEYTNHFGIAGSKTNELGSFIVTDERLQLPEQHEQFLHELGHVLRHYGDQTNMPQSLREYQEWDANLFAMYAAIPFHMIDFSKPYTMNSIMEEFNVTKALAHKRIEDIRQKTYWEQRRQRERYVPVFKPFALQNCSDETKRIMKQLSKQTGAKLV